jgi:AcrR family transcriptional regulator
MVMDALTAHTFGVNGINLKSERTRQYRQTARAEAAERTRQAIMGAAVTLWREQDWEQVTLGAIAERAGVTVQTVLRRFGSKDGVVDACLAERASGVEEVRDRAQAGDPQSAIDALLAHYERDGDAVLRTLDLEARSPAARRIVDRGRAEHRAWCARVFAPYLPAPRAGSYRARLDAFVAATDIYVWKLVRRDLGRTRQQTRDAFAALLGGLTATRPRGGKR